MTNNGPGKTLSDNAGDLGCVETLDSLRLRCVLIYEVVSRIVEAAAGSMVLQTTLMHSERIS